MPRDPDDGETDAAQSANQSTSNEPHTVFIQEPVVDRITALGQTDQVEPHTLGGSVFSSEYKGSSLAFHITELKPVRGQEQMPESVGVIDVDIDSRHEPISQSEKPVELPRLEVTAIDPLEGHVITSGDNQQVTEAVASFQKVVTFEPRVTDAPDRTTQVHPETDQMEPNTQQESDGQRGRTPAQETQATREQPHGQTDRSNRGPGTSTGTEADQGEASESRPLNVNEEIRALSTMFDGISKSDFWVLDNGNIGVELSLVPTSDAVDSFEILLEYDDSFPEYPPRVWVQSPDLSSDDEAVVEVDYHGDARIEYIDPHTWAQQQNTEIALEHLAEWATAYCKRQESTTGEEMIRQTREYAEEAGQQIIDGFAGQVQSDDEKDGGTNQEARNTPDDRQQRDR